MVRIHAGIRGLLSSISLKCNGGTVSRFRGSLRLKKAQTDASRAPRLTPQEQEMFGLRYVARLVDLSRAWGTNGKVRCALCCNQGLDTDDALS